MKYNEIKIGDVFTIAREDNGVAYVKNEFWYQQLNNGRKYKALNGGTKVTKIGELIKVWLLFQFGYLSFYQ